MHAPCACGGSVFTFSFIGLILVMQLLSRDFPGFKLRTWYGNWILIYAIAANILMFSFMNATTWVIHSIALGVGALLGAAFLQCRRAAG